MTPIGNRVNIVRHAGLRNTARILKIQFKRRMAGNKKNTRARAQMPPKFRPSPRSVVPTSAAFDAASAAYLRLLSDPCAADMVAPTFGGTGSGYLMRTKFVKAMGNFSDGVFEFTPQFITQPYRFCGAAVTGAALGTAAYDSAPSQLRTIAGTYRCVAACMKVYYTGSELTRQGIVASSLTGGPYLYNAQAPTETAAGFAEKATRYVRLGTEMHEVRWVPQESDQNFVSMNQPEATVDYFSEGATIQIVVVNAPANTIQFEVTAVWEWTPATDPATAPTGGSIVYAPRSPVTPLPLSATLHKIGDLARFATDPAVHAGLGKRLSSTFAFGQGVYNMVKTVAPGMKAVGRLAGRAAPFLLM
jgi:hypothetical protein